MGERERVAWCWCCHWAWCGGVGVPGWRGGGEADLCDRCEADRAAAAERAESPAPAGE